MWQRGLLKLIDFGGWIHRDCLILWSFDVFHYDLRGDSLGVWAKWRRGLLILIDLDRSGVFLRDGYIGIACFYGVPMYSFLRYIGI